MIKEMSRQEVELGMKGTRIRRIISIVVGIAVTVFFVSLAGSHQHNPSALRSSLASPQDFAPCNTHAKRRAVVQKVYSDALADQNDPLGRLEQVKRFATENIHVTDPSGDYYGLQPQSGIYFGMFSPYTDNLLSFKDYHYINPQTIGIISTQTHILGSGEVLVLRDQANFTINEACYCTRLIFNIKQIPNETFDRYFEFTDKDKNGMISLDEFIGAAIAEKGDQRGWVKYFLKIPFMKSNIEKIYNHFKTITNADGEGMKKEHVKKVFETYDWKTIKYENAFYLIKMFVNGYFNKPKIDLAVKAD